jgi:outer membrane protein assembly factor BamB
MLSTGYWLPKSKLLFLILAVCGFGSFAFGQGGQWLTYGHDPQRSGVADERAFTPANVSEMGLAWKTVLPNQPLSMNGLTTPLVARGVATPSGPRNLVLVAGSSDHVFALDADSGELVWKVDAPPEMPRPSHGDWLCPNALNDTPVIDAGKARLFVITSDGRLLTLALADGRQLMPPARFVPPYSKMWSLNYSGGVLYTSISQDCNNAHSGIAAMNPDAPGKPVIFFSTTGACEKSFCGAGIWGRGGPAVDFSGYVYGATGDAPFDPAANMFGDTLVKLAPGSLDLAGYYTPADWEYLTRKDLDMGTTTPAIFRWRHRVLAAIGGKEGAVYLVDTATMSGPQHRLAGYISPRFTNARQTFEANGIWGAMSVWHDPDGNTWLYVPSWGQPTAAAQFPQANGAVKSGSIMAFKVVSARDGGPTLQPAWISGEITVPDPVALAGGVAFVLGTGENPQQVQNGDISKLLRNREDLNTGHAILYALDARTGRRLWSSGHTMTGWTHFSGLAVADGKVFASTHDGTVYAFALRPPGAPAARTWTYAAPVSETPAAAAKPAAEAAASAAPQCGETSQVFAQHCAMCHGPDGKGIASRHTPDFTSPGWQQAHSDSELMNAVAKGTESGMPAFGDQLTPQQIDALVHCMIRGFAPPAGR